MTLVYVGLAVNFIFIVVSWVLFFKLFQRKGDDEDLRLQIKSAREDIYLVTKNPAAARRKLKSSQ
jgi:hypothetical protein